MALLDGTQKQVQWRPIPRKNLKNLVKNSFGFGFGFGLLGFGFWKIIRWGCSWSVWVANALPLWVHHWVGHV